MSACTTHSAYHWTTHARVATALGVVAEEPAPEARDVGACGCPQIVRVKAVRRPEHGQQCRKELEKSLITESEYHRTCFVISPSAQMARSGLGSKRAVVLLVTHKTTVRTLETDRVAPKVAGRSSPSSSGSSATLQALYPQMASLAGRLLERIQGAWVVRVTHRTRDCGESSRSACFILMQFHSSKLKSVLSSEFNKLVHWGFDGMY